MKNWILWTYSMALAIAITAVSFTFYSSGGEFFVLPGLITELLTNGLLFLLVPTGDYYLILPQGSFLIFNVIIYASISYLIFALTRKARRTNT